MRALLYSIALAGAALSPSGASAHVSFLGKAVTAEHYYIDHAVSADESTHIVDGSGDAMWLSLGQLPKGIVGYTVDMDGASIDIRMTYTGVAKFDRGAMNGLVLTSDAFDVPAMLASFRIDAHPRFRFDTSRISRFGEKSILFDFQGLRIRDGLGFTATFDFASPAPEPAVWAMMIGGFALAGGALRTRVRPGRTAARAL